MSEGKQQNLTSGFGGTYPPHLRQCSGEHRYFIACEAVVEAEGKVVLLGLCIHCKDPLQLEFKVASPENFIRIEKSKEKSEKEI